MALPDLLAEADTFSDGLVGIRPEETTFAALKREGWLGFAQEHDVDPHAAGAYLPVTFSAAVDAEAPFADVTTLHEYYGHGLFVEHTELGARLHADPKMTPRERGLYEGIAMLLEEAFAERLGMKNRFTAKMERTSPEVTAAYSHYQKQAGEHGLHYVLYAAGFPRIYDEARALKLLRQNFPGDWRDVDFAFLYGSRKPHSDIDYLVVSRGGSVQHVDHILDIAVVNRHEFLKRVSWLDIAATDPLFTGTLIYGDAVRIEKLKRQALNTPITPRLISRHVAAGEEQRRIASRDGHGLDRATAASYASSYFAAAFLMGQGKKALTKRDIDAFLV